MRDRLRALAAGFTVLGIAGFAFCFLQHVCMEGHGRHPPYPYWHFAVETAWMTCFAAMAWCSLRSNVLLGLAYTVVGAALVVSRLRYGSGGGLHFSEELLGLLVLVVIAGSEAWRSSRSRRRMMPAGADPGTVGERRS